MTIENLEVVCREFANTYLVDVVKKELCSEMNYLKQIHASNLVGSDKSGNPTILKPLALLNKIANLKLASLFPNVCIALRIFLILPVTVASGERSFSKLKLIKNKMRNSTG